MTAGASNHTGDNLMNGKQTNRRAFRLSALAAITMILITSPVPAIATPPSGLTTTEIGTGDLPDPVRVKLKDERTGHEPRVDASRIVVSEFNLQPGGETGWHSHGGPVWAVIISGTVHLYSGEDPDCRPEIFPAGTVFLDPGDHAHIARNESSEAAIVHTLFMLPEDGELRVDEDDPGNCPF
jgi:quercetin dioxygenase-like cupin family protein